MFTSNYISVSGNNEFLDNHSVDFDGTNDYIILGASNALMRGTDISISMWIKFDGTAGNIAFWVRRGANDTNLRFINVGTAGDKDFLLQSWNGSSLDGLTLPSSTIDLIDSGKWHHLVLKVTDGSQAIFVDGESIVTGTATVVSAASLGTAYVGLGPSVPALDGKVSDIAIYDGLGLESHDVLTIYNNRQPFNHNDWKYTNKLTTWLRFGDGFEQAQGTALYYENNEGTIASGGTLTNFGSTPYAEGII